MLELDLRVLIPSPNMKQFQKNSQITAWFFKLMFKIDNVGMIKPEFRDANKFDFRLWDISSLRCRVSN